MKIVFLKLFMLIVIYILVTCPTVSNPSSGSVTISTNGTLSRADFACSVGYHVTGNDIISCQTNGLWDASDPLCGTLNNV